MRSRLRNQVTQQVNCDFGEEKTDFGLQTAVPSCPPKLQSFKGSFYRSFGDAEPEVIKYIYTITLNHLTLMTAQLYNSH